MLVMPEEMVTDVRALQFVNVLCPMLVTLEGMMTEVRPEQP